MIFRSEISMRFGKLKRGEKCVVNGDKATYLGSYRNQKHNGEPWVHLMRMDGAGIPTILEVTTTANISCVQNGMPVSSNQVEIAQ